MINFILRCHFSNILENRIVFECPKCGYNICKKLSITNSIKCSKCKNEYQLELKNINKEVLND